MVAQWTGIGVLFDIGREAWGRELVAILPKSLKKYFGSNKWVVVDDIQNANLSGSRDDKPIAVLLPGEDVLLRRFQVPLISLFRLPKLMKYEAARHIPLPLDQVTHDFRLVSRNRPSSRMIVELAIIRTEAVQLIRSKMEAVELKPEAFAIYSEGEIWFARRPLIKSWLGTFTRRRQKLFLNRAVSTLLTLAFILAIQNWTTRFAEDRDAAVTVARMQAAGITPIRQHLDALNDELSFLRRARNRASALSVAEEVAHLLPDNAWLQEIDIEDQTVQLRGTAQQATDLLQVLSASSIMRNAQFEAPLTAVQGSDGQQFDITMTRN